MDNKSKSVQNLNDLCQKSYGNSEVFWEIEDQMPCSEIIEQMPNSEIPDTTNTTDIIDDSEKDTRLPTLHIEHDASAVRKLKRLYVRTGLVAIFSVIATIAIAILIFYIWAKVIRFKVPFFILIVIIGILGAFSIYLVQLALYKTKTYFKNKFLREEIEAICDIETFNGDEDKSAIFQFGYEENKRFDYITGPANTNMIKNLGIGGNGWERCQINDDFSGKYLGTRFRFLNTLLKKEIENQKNTKHETIFQGQVFIFQTNLNIKRPIQYNYCIENPCHKHSDFKNAFASSYFDNDILNPEYSTNPFLKTPSKFDRLRTTQRYARENRPEFETLETPDFVDNMLRLGQIIPDELWGVRFEGDKFILIISRYRNFFELNKMNPKTSLANLDKDMQELVNILSTVSQMDFIEKE